ncbi:hypothetical protein HYT02_05435 [Candidatus Gottesmanbacteria bacterium]|nr:hypothetical protein [Candidatus Gottesmanbacteria bacterium]
MKKDPIATAHAAGITAGIIFVVCRLAFALLPNLTMAIAQSWFHSIALNQVSGSLTTGSFILGLVSLIISAWLVGYVFANLYNYFLKSK